jgi:hypothetical protein
MLYLPHPSDQIIVLPYADNEEGSYSCKEEVYFWPLNYNRSLVLAIEPENQESLAIQLLKPFIFYHQVVLAGGFDDVAAMWRWGPHVSIPPSSLSSLLSSLSAACSSPRRRGRADSRRRARARTAVPWRPTSSGPPTGRGTTTLRISQTHHHPTRIVW